MAFFSLFVFSRAVFFVTLSFREALLSLYAWCNLFAKRRKNGMAQISHPKLANLLSILGLRVTKPWYDTLKRRFKD